MRILILDESSSVWGSTRIYRDYLADYLTRIGIDVSVNAWEDSHDYELLLFGKNVDLPTVLLGTKKWRSAKVGLIHPDDTTEVGRKKIALSNFSIVGSLEERDYLTRYYSRVFQFPQIEKVDIAPKVHRNKEVITIGYHGNRMHLQYAGDEFWGALERLSLQYDVRLKAVYNIESSGKLRISRNIDVEHVQWAKDSAWREISKCDIGVVPGCVRVNRVSGAIEKLFRPKHGFRRDYLLRYKYNSNAGRSFVFYQLGIPVVAGFVPSHFHILGNPECGYLANCEEGWHSSLRALITSTLLRQSMADSARKEFQRSYDPEKWARRLETQLAELVSTGSNKY